jgi:hemerythrin-like domain-containing protein
MPMGAWNRRGFIAAAAAVCGGVLLEGCQAASGPRKRTSATGPEKPEPEEEVSPAEDLMREHGVLKRVLLIYGEALRRFSAGEDVPPEALKDSATIIRTFIEDYHEKLEENHLFPRFRKAGKLVDLVDVLQQQHQVGRRLTDTTLRLSTAQAIHDPQQQRVLTDSLRQFIRMYSPHEAREDTVLFPAFRQIVAGKEYDELGDQFEKREHELFGEDGFEKMVDRVASIENTLGIYDLDRFTPTA